MSIFGGSQYQPGLVAPMSLGGGVVPYVAPYAGMMGGLGSGYGAPIVNTYPPTIVRDPSVIVDNRSLYGDDYNSDYYPDRRYSIYGDDYRHRPIGSGASRRSRRRDYYDWDYDPDYDYEYDPGYCRDGYGRDYRYRSNGYYPSFYHHHHHHSSYGSGHRRDHMSVIGTPDGYVKVLHNGREYICDKFRRLLGIDPMGVNVVRLQPGETFVGDV